MILGLLFLVPEPGRRDKNRLRMNGLRQTQALNGIFSTLSNCLRTSFGYGCKISSVRPSIEITTSLTVGNCFSVWVISDRIADTRHDPPTWNSSRSEERRVGKECRC